MQLIDSHCHLDFPDFAAEQAEIIARAKARGVQGMLTISTYFSKLNDLLAITERYQNIWCSVGVHPHHVAELDEQITEDDLIKAINTHPQIVGVGEAGLDYHYDFAPKEKQQAVFRTHIRACLATGLPLIVHSREAEEDTIAVIEDERARHANGRELKVLLHCFSSSQWLADKGLENGYHFSFSGIVTFPKSLELQAVATAIPLDRILVETDAPYLAPPPYRGKRNEPSYVVHVAEKLAELKDVGLNEIAAQTTANFFNLFTRAKLVA